MNFEHLEELNKEFASELSEIQKEFNEVFQKWIKKAPRTCIVSILSLPLGIIFTLMQQKDGVIEGIFPELPDVWERYLSPWILLKEKWGKISSEQFMKEYGDLYESQFKAWFLSNEEKEAFHKWYRAQNKKNAD